MRKRAQRLVMVLVLLVLGNGSDLHAQNSFGFASVGVAFEKGRSRPMLHAALGGERRFGSSDAAWGGEFGFVAFRDVDPSTLGLASANLSYHVPTNQTPLRWDPFISGGGTLAFSGGVAAGLQYGGGVNRWGVGGIGARLEFRHTPFRAGTDGFDFFILRVGMLFH